MAALAGAACRLPSCTHPRRAAASLRRPLVSDRAHAPRASNVEELRALQKSSRERDEATLGLRELSLSETLRSKARQVSCEPGRAPASLAGRRAGSRKGPLTMCRAGNVLGGAEAGAAGWARRIESDTGWQPEVHHPAPG